MLLHCLARQTNMGIIFVQANAVSLLCWKTQKTLKLLPVHSWTTLHLQTDQLYAAVRNKKVSTSMTVCHGVICGSLWAVLCWACSSSQRGLFCFSTNVTCYHEDSPAVCGAKYLWNKPAMEEWWRVSVWWWDWWEGTFWSDVSDEMNQKKKIDWDEVTDMVSGLRLGLKTVLRSKNEILSHGLISVLFSSLAVKLMKWEVDSGTRWSHQRSYVWFNSLPTSPVTATGLCKDVADRASRQRVKQR